ncbi:MAG: FtsQ-type POTRA domain-containing protein [bacterium]|nr:FtsQ-type POTRA domain-containing protein [bacterium]
MKSYGKLHRYRKKRYMLKNRFFWLASLALTLVTSLVSFLFFSGTFLIERVVVIGEQKVSKEAIKTLILPQNIFLIDTQAVRMEILGSFPQIAEVKISRGFPDSLNISVVERVPVITWCQEDDCFLLDSKGIIFEKTAVNEAGDQRTLIRNLNDGEPNLGERVIEEEELSKILEIESLLKSGLKIEVKEFTTSSDDKLVVLTEDNWEIYFSLANDIDWQGTKLRAVLEEKIPQKDRRDLEYIDLRFGNFAPYKYKD